MYGAFPTTSEYTAANSDDLRNNFRHCLDLAWQASKGIRTIPDQKDQGEDFFNAAKEKIAKAKTVYILGYGFDKKNSEYIGLDQLHRNKPPRGGSERGVYFTNYRDSNRISKIAGTLFISTGGDTFINRNIMGERNDRFHEKSTKDVYGAMAYDF